MMGLFNACLYTSVSSTTGSSSILKPKIAVLYIGGSCCMSPKKMNCVPAPLKCIASMTRSYILPSSMIRVFKESGSLLYLFFDGMNLIVFLILPVIGSSTS